MTAEQVYRSIRTRFAAPEYLCIPQVRSSVGFVGKPRYADAVAISMYPSRGLYAHGFEIKVARSDMLREIADPDKAEAVAQYCTFWSLALAPDLLKDADDIPVNWGIFVVKSNGLHAHRKPKANADVKPPTWAFFAAVLRNAMESTPDAEVERRIAEAVADRTRRLEVEHRDATKALLEKVAAAKSTGLRDAQVRIKEFEERSGIKIDQWSSFNDKRIGKAVELILDGELKLTTLRHMADTVRKLSGTIDSAITDLEEPSCGLFPTT